MSLQERKRKNSRDGYAQRVAKAKLESRFEIKSQVMGPGAVSAMSRHVGVGDPDFEKESTEGRVLNRVIRWTEYGWEMEPDQRHVDILVKDLDLQESKPVSIPGEVEARAAEEEGTELLNDADSTRYRALAARANYLAADRTDIMYAVEDICRSMAAPRPPTF